MGLRTRAVFAGGEKSLEGLGVIAAQQGLKVKAAMHMGWAGCPPPWCMLIGPIPNVPAGKGFHG